MVGGNIFEKTKDKRNIISNNISNEFSKKRF